MYSRPEFAKKVGAQYSELRYYERRGILMPDDVDKVTHKHYYSENAVNVYNYIQKLQKIGYSLDEIQSHLDGTDGLSDEDFYTKRETELKNQLDCLLLLKSEKKRVKRQISKRRYKRPSAKKIKE